MTTWSDLEERGWTRQENTNGKLVFIRPRDTGGGKVNRKRDLTESERLEFGEVLFPGRSKRNKLEVAPAPSQTNTTSQTNFGSDVFEAGPSSQHTEGEEVSFCYWETILFQSQ